MAVICCEAGRRKLGVADPRLEGRAGRVEMVELIAGRVRSSSLGEACMTHPTRARKHGTGQER